MADPPIDEKEKKRRKQAKKMGKILAVAWSFQGGNSHFQEAHGVTSPKGDVLDLSTIGQKLDENQYKLGRHGWEDFARDLGGVYNRHIHRYVFNGNLNFCAFFFLTLV